MPQVDEKDVYNALLKYEGSGEVRIGDTKVTVRLTPIDIHSIDSPDFLLWVSMEFTLFGQPMELRVPIPVEAEKGGIQGGALEDLQKLVERGRHPADVPMLVIAQSGYESRTVEMSLPVRFNVSQIPVRLLSDE